MSNRVRVFSEFSPPAGLHLWALTFIGVMLAFLVIVPADVLHHWLGWQLWTLDGVEPERTTAGMLWLLLANLVSIVAVLLLLIDLWRLVRGVADQSFEVDADRIKTRCGEELTEAIRQRPAGWALRPLDWTFGISVIAVIAVCASFAIAVFAFFPKVTPSLFVGLTMLTGLGYLSVMTVGDLFAHKAFKRCSCLKHNWPANATEPQKAALTEDFEKLMGILGEYDRVIRFVDLPILASLAVITTYKFFTLGAMDGYHIGFISGSVAMHVIIANAISLLIVSVNTRAEHDQI